MDAPLIPVILSGGAGTRLWPVSRRAFPKPFMRMPDGQSLLEKTCRRALAVATTPAHVLTVTGLVGGNTLTFTNAIGHTVQLLAGSATVWGIISIAGAAQSNV